MESAVVYYHARNCGKTYLRNLMTEDQLQQKCVMWFDEEYPQHRGMLFSIPNGGERSKQAARLMVSTGVKAGVADLALVLYQETVFIEMKIPGGSQSDEQKEWQRKVELRNNRYFLLWSFEEFKATIKSLI